MMAGEMSAHIQYEHNSFSFNIFYLRLFKSENTEPADIHSKT